MDEAKVYNICLQRVKFQVVQAKQRLNGRALSCERVILESYNTGEMEDIIDILEIYDLEERNVNGLRNRLDDLAHTVSILVKDKLEFAFDERGNLGLYLIVKKREELPVSGDAELAAASAFDGRC